VNGISILVHNTDPFEMFFSHPVSQSDVFSHGPWAGRSLEEAAAEAKRLGRLPDGLEIEAQKLRLPNGDEIVVAVNNRTLLVARMAGLGNVPYTDRGGATFHKLQTNFRETGVGGPLENPC
jgi:hypothetical protein